MKPHPAAGAEEEISALIDTLHETGQRLELLTAGEVDSVSDAEGRPFLLLSAQERLRHIEAAKQAAVLNALPAHIALLDAQGVIVSVNEAWRQFGDANAGQSPGHGLGVDYLAICDRAQGENAVEARRAAKGIRAVLAGTTTSFSLEYPCHAPAENRWFLMMVGPLAEEGTNSAIVMHIDITARRCAELDIQRLNRGNAMLSQINGLIVRVRSRDELFNDACRIAVEVGNMRTAWVGVVDRVANKVMPVASAGADPLDVDADERLMVTGGASSGDSPCAIAVRERDVVLVNKVDSDPRLADNSAYIKRDIRSLVALPLVFADGKVAALCLYSSQPDNFDEMQLKLWHQLAERIAFGIDYIEKQDRLDHLAYYDDLTGLANRNLFLERVAHYMKIAATAGHSLALVLLDLERFKNFNDSLGRPAGDALLRQVAEWLTHSFGDASLLARVSGDQFGVIFPEIRTEADLARLLDSLMAVFRGQSFHLKDSLYRVAAKAGVAMFPPDGEQADILFLHAEAALKNAKTSGERCVFYTPKMTEDVTGKLMLENQLRQAIDREEFVLHYQPKVSCASGQLAGAEALLRWNDPRSGLVPPNRFIPLLEETGLIHEAGRWALGKAVADYLRWRDAGLPAVRIAVNVSALQLRSSSFISELEQALAVDVHASAGLELEITESLVMADVRHSIATLQAVRAMGVSVAIDDFGTGFSSLSYLAKLPVDSLKIDRAFVADMTDSSQGQALVRTIITLAHSLGLKVVAEGVETEGQSRLLRLMGCDEMQGFLFSKSLPVETFEARFLITGVSAD